MNKSQLGFACGKNCADCGDSVSLDCHGRYTCFTCGHFVQTQDDSKPGALKLRKVKGGQVEFFAADSAFMKMIKGE